jgi:hypothetical protein
MLKKTSPERGHVHIGTKRGLVITSTCDIVKKTQRSNFPALRTNKKSRVGWPKKWDSDTWIVVVDKVILLRVHRQVPNRIQASCCANSLLF